MDRIPNFPALCGEREERMALISVAQLPPVPRAQLGLGVLALEL